MVTTLTRDAADIKCVVVGDGGVGKTSMLIRYINGKFLKDYIPTCFDSYAVSTDLGDKSYELCLMDTAGQETYDRLRTLSYYNTDIFVVCFSVINPDSLINVKSRWIPELKAFKPGTPFILVGTQSDLRDDEDSIEFVTSAQGRKLARKVGALCYIECSSLTGEGIKDVFRRSVLAAVRPRKKKSVWKSVKRFFSKG